MNILHSQIDWAEINQQNDKLSEELKKQGYEVIGFASQSSPGNLISEGVKVYAGDDVMELTHNPPSDAAGGPVWKFGGKEIFSSAKYEISANRLRVRSVTLADRGRYECRYTRTSAPTLIYWSDININPNPVITPDFSQKRVACEQSVKPRCCVKGSTFKVKLIFRGDEQAKSAEGGCAMYTYSTKPDECGTDKPLTFTCELEGPPNRKIDITVNVEAKDEVKSCSGDGNLGLGDEGDTVKLPCPDGKVGELVYKCAGGKWEEVEDNCILEAIKNLEEESQNLNGGDISNFVDELSATTSENINDVITSQATVASIVTILDNVATASNNIIVDQGVMTDFLGTVTVIVSLNATATWNGLNNDANAARRRASSNLLRAVETMTRRLSEKDTFEIVTDTLSLSKSVVTAANNTLTTNSSVIIIPATELSEKNTSVTLIDFFTLNEIMSSRNSEENTENITDIINLINANIVLVNTSQKLENISLTFTKNNSELANPLCVFWNFQLFNNTGGWDSFGCEPKLDENFTVTCECNHTTSFSILMSPYVPPEIQELLAYITYIGVGISLGSLVICLIIEIIVWRALTTNDTAYMRHVCIVNIAVSLLIADIWFIVGAAASKENGVVVGPCTAATFFAHFFYLAMFFWMLISALLLLYRILWVFSHMPKWAMLLIGFFVGYGGPLITAVVTVASTAGHDGYISNSTCWLNWDDTKALLAFVIPVLVIVFINFCIMMVVLVKMVRRGVGDTAQNDEKHNLKVIAKCVAILTPLFGLTWGFGIGIMIAPANFGLHVVFALLNSLQGFFILVFGTLLDNKVRAVLARKPMLSVSGSGQTRSTSGGASSSSGFRILRRAKAKRGFNIVTSNHSSSSDSSVNP